MELFGLSSSEMLLYGGIALMIVVFVLAILCGVVFRITGQRIRKNLEQEYGKLKH